MKRNTVKPELRSMYSSEYIGVSWHKGAGKWKAQLMTKSKKNIYLGLFEFPEDAARAYDAAAKKLGRKKLNMVEGIGKEARKVNRKAIKAAKEPQEFELLLPRGGVSS